MTRIESWLPISNTSDFTVYNLPFGIFSTDNLPEKRVGVAIGDQVVDLAGLAELRLLDVPKALVENPYLNDFIGLGKEKTRKVRSVVQRLLTDPNAGLKEQPQVLIDQSQVQMHLPVCIGDYTDFYSSIEHATNVGKMFRDPENALLPNWKHLPVGYHGRASSIIVSGEPVYRPKGQVMPPNESLPQFQPSARVDFELEMAFVIGRSTKLGQSITTEQAEDYIFGKVLFNDWSARDIQKWEYVPLGPFLAKNFGSSISPWVVTMEALEPFRIQGPNQDPEVLPYLKYAGPKNYNIDLEVGLQPDGGQETIISRSNFKYMYWNMAQQLAHHTVNGCNVQIGDMMASGTISGPTEESFGSMLELSWAGSKPLTLNDGSTRTFIQDGDTVIMRGCAEKEGMRVGFGEVRSQLLGAYSA